MPNAQRLMLNTKTPALVLTLVVLAAAAAAQQGNADPRAILNRATDDFLAGRVADSVVGFDRVAQLVPDAAPQLWQRGIALYYVGRYRDCRRQFESHRTVNPADVENAAWHFLCVARDENPTQARAALLPVGPDSREPMREIYRMFQGTVAPEGVLVAGNRNASARFYASLYVGLYLEAFGEERARFYITQAASDEFAGTGGYMRSVAQVHMQVRGWGQSASPAK
jgi:hypothetical protein